jgi:hypothetical protein
MKHDRIRLLDRRPNETVELVFNGTPYAVTAGFFRDTGRVGEVFTHGAKVGSATVSGTGFSTAGTKAAPSVPERSGPKKNTYVLEESS